MIFLCFAVKNRMPYINDLYQYFQNFGLNVWYDRRNIYLGDDRYETNIELGANRSDLKYAVVIYSDDFANGNICLDEYKILVKRHNSGEIHIFPVFLNEVPTNIDDKFALLKQLVYKQINSPKDYLAVTLHIVAKLCKDELKSLPNNWQSFKGCIMNYIKDSLLHKMLTIYINIPANKYEMRITSLYYIFCYITSKDNKNYMHYKTMNYLFNYTLLYGLVEEKRELQIMEDIIIFELYNYLYGSC